MLGLKTQESYKFLNFMEIVQQKAKDFDSIFFLDAGDGNDFIFNDIEGENLTGWLIPNTKINEFRTVWELDNVDDKWVEFFCFVIWKQENSKLTVSFEFV